MLLIRFDMCIDTSFAVSERWLSRLGTKWLGLSSDRVDYSQKNPASMNSA